MTTTVEARPGWLDPEQLGDVRGRVPMVYVEAVPVRVDHLGRVTRVGFLLRPQADGTLSREVVSGRVLLGFVGVNTTFYPPANSSTKTSLGGKGIR